MSIYLIRHAQSIGNVNGRTESHASIPLTKLGHEQAKKLVELLPKADRVYISPFIRTRLTADPILQRDQITPEIYAIEEFSYLSDTRCKNTTLEERKPWVDEYWNCCDVDLISSDGAESFRHFYLRVSTFIEHLDSMKIAYQNKNLMVFSHGQFLQLFKMMTDQHRELSAELMRDFRHEILNNPIGNANFFSYQ